MGYSGSGGERSLGVRNGVVVGSSEDSSGRAARGDGRDSGNSATRTRHLLPLPRATFWIALLAVSVTLPVAAAETSIEALQRLDARYPGVQHLRLGDRSAVFGKPMTVAETPFAAADRFLAEHREVFGVENAELRITEQLDLRHGELVAFWFEQTVAGLPVEYGMGRVLVLDRGTDAVVVYATAQLADTQPEEWAPIEVDADLALERVQRHRLFRDLEFFSEPELVVIRSLPGDEAPTPRRTWRVQGWNESLVNPRGFVFHLDTRTGAILEARSEIYHVDVDGTVSALATPGDSPDIAGNPPVPMPLPEATVAIGGSSVFSDYDGNYTVPFGGTGFVNVNASLVSPWTVVIDAQGSVQGASASGTAPGPVDLLFNPSPNQFTTAQVNAFLHVNKTHQLFAERAPSLTALDLQVDCNVNIDDSCNAFFSPFAVSVNFFTAGQGCTNSAFSDIIQHEYGHFIVWALGLEQDAFGEGYGDICSMVFADDAVVGAGFFGPGTAVRNIPGANVQYPCPGSIPGDVHFCGQIIGGVWWDFRENLGAMLGPDLGRETAIQHFVDWSQITLGGIEENSAHPLMAVEFLVVDDDDGDFDTATPHISAICDAFSDHSIFCPTLPPARFSLTEAPTGVVASGETVTIRFTIEALSASLVPGTEQLWHSPDGSTFGEVPLTALGGGEFEATLPAVDCGRHQFFASVDLTGGTTINSAPNGVNWTLPVGDELVESFVDFMESPGGWTVGSPTDDATTGIWEQGDPLGTQAQPALDHTPTGTECWFTGQGTGGGQGQNDVDGGVTTLVSPAIDATLGETRIEFYVWYINMTGATPGSDIFEIEISGNGGAAGSWVPAIVLGPQLSSVFGGWNRYEIWVTDFVVPSSDVRVRFRASDEGAGSIVEAAVDDFRVEYVFCDPAPEFVRGDCNQDLGVEVSDVVALLEGAFGAGGGEFDCADACDNNDDGSIDISDAVFLLAALFIGGDPIPAPTVDCGADPTDLDALECEFQTCP